MTDRELNVEQGILDILRDDAKRPHEEIAKMVGVPKAQVESIIRKLEDNKVIVKYRAVINWDKVVDSERVTALIEVKVTPRRGYGFEKIAERIYQFFEVRSLYLLSGTYDLLAVVEGRTLHEVAAFVAEKLSTLDDVQSTTTHFMLKRFKDDGDILHPVPSVSRLEVTP